mgnify:FL=1
MCERDGGRDGERYGERDGGRDGERIWREDMEGEREDMRGSM